MADELDVDQLMRKTASKLRRLRIAEDQGLQQGVFLMRIHKETIKVLEKPERDPSKPRELTERERDILRRRLNISLKIRNFLDDIVGERRDVKRMHRLIAQYCGSDIPRLPPRMRHRMFVPTKPKRSLAPEKLEAKDDEIEEKEYTFEIMINFRTNCLRKRFTPSDIEEICIVKDRLKIYGRRNLRQPYKFLP